MNLIINGLRRLRGNDEGQDLLEYALLVALIALVAGEVQMGFVAEGSAITAGERFVALAVTGQERSATSPRVPRARRSPP